MTDFCISRKVKRKKVARLFNGETAYKALADGGFDRGMETFGFNKGQFSIIDLIDAALEMSGPADVVISTWTAAGADLSRVKNFLQRGKISSARWVVDYSFETRQPLLCKQLREMFGENSIRTIASHCKFVLIKNEKWNIVIQTSMNLNMNKRLENFWICDDIDFYNEFENLVSDIFDLQDKSFGEKPSKYRSELGRLGEGQKTGLYELTPIAKLL